MYVSHCSSCHTIKHIGKATIGPDLIIPKTIFDYYPDNKQLKQFIRNPESVRKLPNSRMSGSSYAGLNDADLEDLIDYFEFIIKSPRRLS
ncbi:c-type cytochrome [Legionella birminghamensis]|uniref:c-type cytochrome n=1 Tax=Legionella birminghamensis TaxID=28083 RepID=UPI0009F8B4C2|nr:cytochrome c [Legionella birminghamensis]